MARNYQELWDKVQRLNRFEKESLLHDIFIEFESREIFGVDYPAESFFEETIRKAVEKEKIAQ